jgi:predicted nucleic acid-binding protein
MIVIDASLALDLVLRRPHVSDLVDILATTNDPVYAPEIIDIEVLHALRKQLNLKRISIEVADRAIKFLSDMPIARQSHGLLLTRIWQLRDNLSAYDAAYIALTELHDAELWTCDSKFSGTPGHTAKIKLFLPAP